MIAIIPARGGSQRIANKNRKDFWGRPIITYSIETALASGLFRDVYVSTDDHKIGSIAFQAGADVVLRPQELAGDDVGTQEVAAAVLRQVLGVQALEDANGTEACVIYATAPMMCREDLHRGLMLLRSSRNNHYAYSVRHGTDEDAGQFYWGRARSFLEAVPLEGNSILVPVEETRVCDINTPDDWLRAEQMYTRVALNWRGKRDE